MKRNKPFWRDVRLWNDNFFARLGIECDVIETSNARIKHFIGADARLVASEDYGDFRLESYESADTDYCVVRAAGEALVYQCQLKGD